MNSTTQAVQKIIRRVPRGTPFLSSKFLGLGPRAAIDQTLSRLVRSGKIRRLSRGVFVRPAMNPYVGEVLPGVREIAERMALETGHRIQTHGSEIARKFGLSTQMAAHSIFLTNGPSKTIRVGGGQVHLRHVTERKLGPRNSSAGEVISLLWYLGKEAVEGRVLERIKTRLSEEQMCEIVRAVRFMPTWMSEAVRKSGWLSFHAG